MKKHTAILFVGVAVIAATFYQGCASSQQSPKVVMSQDPVRTSGAKKEWVEDDRTYWVEDSKMFFRTVIDNESDLAFGMRGLDGQAYQTLINKVQLRAGMELDEAMVGSKLNPTTIGQFRQWVLNSIGDVQMSGLSKEREYWELYDKAAANGNGNSYLIYGLYSLPEAEYRAAKAGAWDRAAENVERPADLEAKKLLNEAKGRFLSR